MRPLTTGALVLAAAGAVLLVRRRTQTPLGVHGSGAPTSTRAGWLTVTIAADAEPVRTAGRTGPLRGFGDALEVEVRPASGDKGTELRARPTSNAAHTDARDLEDLRGRLRAALRETKQLVEVGEVLRVDPTPHGHRSATPTGALVDAVARRSNRGGTL